jgi:hypothetical protein
MNRTNSLVAGLAVCCLFGVLSGGAAQASSIVTGDEMYFGNWSGGSATANALAPSNFTPFPTFCAELEGVLWVNGGSSYAYRVTGIGLSNDSTTPSTMTEHTAFLYTAFLNGTLPGFIAGNVAQQEAVQYGVWRSLGYTDAYLDSRSSEILQGNLVQARTDYYNLGWDLTPGTWTGFGDIRIANLQYMVDGSGAQDVLVQSADCPVVPEPAALGLVGLGLIGLVAHKRRKQAMLC